MAWSGNVPGIRAGCWLCVVAEVRTQRQLKLHDSDTNLSHKYCASRSFSHVLICCRIRRAVVMSMHRTPSQSLARHGAGRAESSSNRNIAFGAPLSDDA